MSPARWLATAVPAAAITANVPVTVIVTSVYAADRRITVSMAHSRYRTTGIARVVTKTRPSTREIADREHAR